jgi:hypothetical protein
MFEMTQPLHWSNRPSGGRQVNIVATWFFIWNHALANHVLMFTFLAKHGGHIQALGGDVSRLVPGIPRYAETTSRLFSFSIADCPTKEVSLPRGKANACIVATIFSALF